MLKQRIITALILIPIVISVIFFLPTPYLALLFAALTVAGGIEWAKLAGLDDCKAMSAYPVFIIAAMAGCYWLIVQKWDLYFLASVSVFWLLMIPLLLSRRKPLKQDEGINYLFLLLGIVLLPASWLSLVLIHQHSAMGASILLFILVLIWTADSGAYFTGKKWGKHKLAPIVSPGKTIEGLLGALVFGIIWSIAYYSFAPYSEVGLPQFMALCFLIIMVSVVGDLFESVLKRKRGVKDSGHILPGHGGILDRVDSVIAAMPVFYTGLMFLAK